MFSSSEHLQCAGLDLQLIQDLLQVLVVFSKKDSFVFLFIKRKQVNNSVD